MRKMRKGVRKILIVAVALVLMGSSSRQVFATEETNLIQSESMEESALITLEVEPQMEVIELPNPETSAMSRSMFSLRADANVPLKSTNHAKWIDRLDLTEADYALTFYDWLVENSDNDNTEDALIEPAESGDDTVKYIGEYLCYVIQEFNETEDFTFTVDASEAEIDKAAAAVVETAITNKFNEVEMYTTAVYSAFDRDCPRVFWLSGESYVTYYVNYTYSYYTGTGKGTVDYTQTIGFILKSDKYDIRDDQYQNQSTSALREKIADVDAKVDTIVAGSASQTTNYEKAKYFNEWLITHNCYNSNLATAGADTHECISALTGLTGTAGPVCEGYARAFKVLCDEAGIPCVLVDGDANNRSGSSEAHMWNYVQIEGNWYAVDVTWNDPSVNGVNNAVSGLENEDYFLVGSDTIIDERSFIASHPVTNTVTENGVAFINGPQLQKNAYDAAVKLAGHSLTLKENLDVNFHMELEQDILDDDTAYMQFTLPGKTEPVKVMVKDIKNSPTPENDYVFTCEVAAKEMADTITAQMFCNNGTEKGAEYTYSVKEYAETLINGTIATEVEKELAKAMLNYGAYAQTYFNYNTGNPANAGYEDDELAISKSGLGDYVPSITESNAALTYAGTSILLESDIKVRHYFKLKDGQTYSGVLDEYVAPQNASVNGTYYFYESEGIPVAELGNMTAYTGVEGITVNYCPLSYITTVVASKNADLTSNANLQSLMKALYLYYQATLAYNS